MAEKRRTTGPLSPEDLHKILHTVPADELIERLDDIFASTELRLPGPLEQLLSLDDYMDRELREMFQSIIAQYFRPVETAVEQICTGNASRRIAEEGLEALRPIISASETLEFQDITGVLRRIETPLVDLAEGARRRLTKRSTAALGKALVELNAFLSRHPLPEVEPEGVPLALAFGQLPRHLRGVTVSDVRKLRGAGIATLRDLALRQAADISKATGIARDKVERLCTFAAGVVAASTAGAGGQRAAKIPAGWMRVVVDSDIFHGRFTFEYAALGPYLGPILERLSKADDRSMSLSAPPARKRTRKPKTEE